VCFALCNFRSNIMSKYWRTFSAPTATES
jgi:hypothetical protein